MTPRAPIARAALPAPPVRKALPAPTEPDHPSRAGGRLACAILLCAFLGCVALAYHRSLASLLGDLGSEAPLASLGLVPVLALGLGFALAPARPAEPRLPSSQLDYIIAVPLFAIAAWLVFFVPGGLSVEYWTARLDLLSLPFFAAGVVALVFGSRVLSRVRVAVVFLALAWPVLTRLAVERFTSVATEATQHAVRASVAVVPVARVAGGRDSSVFVVGRGAGTFVASVASRCAGAGAVVGFLLVGGAFALLLEGRRRAKLTWLAVGVVVVWLLNLARILVIFGVGSIWGREVALGWLHPYGGLAVVAIGTGIMLAALPRFGLKPGARLRGERTRSAPAVPRRPAAPALTLAVLVAALMAAGNARLAGYDPISNGWGRARLVAMAGDATTLKGWDARTLDEVSWAPQYFGRAAVWHRYLYSPAGAGASLGVDVVQADGRHALFRHGLEDCYRLHGLPLLSSEPVRLGHGLLGHATTFLIRDRALRWDAVWWEWPVRGSDGADRFERVVVMQQSPRNRPETTRLIAFSRSLIEAHLATRAT